MSTSCDPAVPATVSDMAAAMNARHEVQRRAALDVFERAIGFDLPDQVRSVGMMPYYRELTRNEGPVCLIDGRQAIMLGSNNYLGLTTHPAVREAAARAVLEDGPSLTGSRLLNGTTTAHTALERKVAEFFGREDALVFTTGYQANIGVMTAFASPETTVVLDRHCHASILDGVRAARAQVECFPHNDVAALDQLLDRLVEQGPCMVMVDGLYSMEGDIAPLPGIAETCRRHGVRLVVDEAHALGVLGATGHGTEEHFGCPGLADLLTGTFSKSLASIGGWVAGSARVIDWMRFFGRSMVFSASMPPAQIAAASTALDLLRAEPWRVTRVNENGQTWREGLVRAGFVVGNSVSPIVPVTVGDDFTCLIVGKALLDAGVYVNPVVYPAVPRDKAMLRTSVMATHEPHHLATALEILETVGRKVGLLKG
ncbi:MAG: pyridoxal phosphate-dependent aminotransferase family protein [Deltaproteobacteria bacterium]|nr:pyridoxal phosphate-dependent aminotransferase family protein [Deltaproteobacteria bacterium]